MGQLFMVLHISLSSILKFLTQIHIKEYEK
ncbi:hypothetical protein HMPREF1528_00071 [Capnocytophaga sp. oral taxon 336 str. F0502]|nr:hypothetical protein HMPREF1528_00071 [Capnocytophaga sp. oral taxon 336 str. F0502]